VRIALSGDVMTPENQQRRRSRRALRRAQARSGTDVASTTHATLPATSQTRSARAQRLSDVIGAMYVVNGDEYVLHAVRHGKVVLRGVQSRNAFICEDVSGPLDVKRWRPRQ
jgi:hypothetical protein